MTRTEFQYHLDNANSIVSKWPPWKQNLLTDSASPTVSVARTPVFAALQREERGFAAEERNVTKDQRDAVARVRRYFEGQDGTEGNEEHDIWPGDNGLQQTIDIETVARLYVLENIPKLPKTRAGGRV